MLDRPKQTRVKGEFMRTKSLKVTWVALVILVWAVLFVVAGLNLWREYRCVINAGMECTQSAESEGTTQVAGF